MKGKPPTDELAALDWPATMFHVEHLTVPGLDAERCLVWLKNKPAA
jgi:16S rRNA (guanine527-N7)-methyltransferase